MEPRTQKRTRLIVLSMLILVGLATALYNRFRTDGFAHELVFDHDFPDPTLIRANDGLYYAYATQGVRETGASEVINIQLARSKDLKSWEHLGEALPNKPSWASSTQKFWAPHIHFANNQYYLYFSADPNSEDGLCLAVATSRNPTGPFVDSGQPLACGPSFSNIDPMIFNDPQTGKSLIYWGSGFDPIRVQALTNSLMQLDQLSERLPLLYPERGSSPAPYTKLLEAPWVIQHGEYFYLFVSGENCCEPPNPQYAVLVARSKNSLGPFEWRNKDPRQSVVIESKRQFTATGHSSFISDETGQLWSYYHGVDRGNSLLKNPIPGDRKNRRVMLRSKIKFVDGWPTRIN